MGAVSTLLRLAWTSESRVSMVVKGSGQCEPVPGLGEKDTARSEVYCGGGEWPCLLSFLPLFLLFCPSSVHGSATLCSPPPPKDAQPKLSSSPGSNASILESQSRCLMFLEPNRRT